LPALERLSQGTTMGRLLSEIRISVVFACVTFAWIFFKLPDFGHALSFASGMFADHSIGAAPPIYRSLALIYALPVLLQHVVPWQRLESRLQPVQPYLYGAMAVLALVEAGPDSSFIYFQF
jgi:hypothetical protein